MTGDWLLQADGIGKRYGDLAALRDFTFGARTDDARIVALAGRSGAGKSTAAQLLLGLLRPTSGTIRYRATPLARLRRAERTRFRREIQAVLQDPFAAFNPFYRVKHVFDVVVRGFGIAEPRRAIVEALAFVGLDAGVLCAYPHELSGGERQRAMLARALLARPRLIVADEPVSMVDASLHSSILEVLLDLRDEAGISFLYITHDLATAYHVADELIVLHDGETVERGAAREVIDAPRHAATRALVNAVPVPDPDVRWHASATEAHDT
jgi:ABC-type oligopeptide transport system ATPase subunit